MKKYQKPAMLELSVSANDLLCGCDVKTRDSDDPFIQDWTKWYGGENGLLDPNDNVFAKDEQGCAYELDTYCKFGPTGQIIFTS